MQAIRSWRNLLNVKGCAVIQLTTITSKSISFFADFHSSATSYEKRKPKSKPDVTAQKASKNHIRFQVRERRADAKKALKSLLLNGGAFHINIQAERDTSLDIDDSKPHFPSRRAAKAHHKRMKRQRRREKNYESDDDPDVFQTAFRKKGYKWSCWSENDFSYESSTGFEWREPPKRNFRRQRDSDIDSDIESDCESFGKDMYCSERKALDLPLTGPLKIEAIKTAFRVSALKWHPDKHQGPAQAMAEEKFKHCVDAYKSLCNSVSTE